MYNTQSDGNKWRMSHSKGLSWGMVGIYVLGSISVPMLLASAGVYFNRVPGDDYLPSIFYHNEGQTMFMFSLAYLTWYLVSIFYIINRTIPFELVKYGVENPPANLSELVSSAFRETGLKGSVGYTVNAADMNVEIVLTHYREDTNAAEKLLEAFKNNNVTVVSLAK